MSHEHVKNLSKALRLNIFLQRTGNTKWFSHLFDLTLLLLPVISGMSHMGKHICKIVMQQCNADCISKFLNPI